MRWLATLLVVGVAACGGPTVVDDPFAAPAPAADPGVVVDPVELADRFVGEWVLDQPFHAAYEATRYAFRADGSLERLEAFPEDFDVGHAIIVDDSACTPDEDPYFCTTLIHCAFADAWSSRGDDALTVTSDCDDGQRRPMALRFLSPPSQNAAPGATVEVTAIGDVTDGGWQRSFDWVWTRCTDADGNATSDAWVCDQLGWPSP